MIGRYKEAFLRALPHLSRQELTWRLHFVMGALSYTLAGTDALKLFAQVTDTDNDELLLQRLAPFLVGAAAGMEINRRATRSLGEAIVRDLAAS